MTLEQRRRTDAAPNPSKGKENASVFLTDGATDEFEFGGSLGALGLMVGFPLLMWYMWIGATYYGGRLPLPDADQTWLEFGHHLCALVYDGAYPTAKACLYATLAVAAALHITRIFPLYTVIDEFGSIMSVAILSGFLNSFIVYFQAILRGRTHRLSGSPIYDFFVGAELNPRIVAQWQRDNTKHMVTWPQKSFFLVAAHFLYANACGKAEQMIITSWDMYYEKLGFMLTFWNMAGVPFTYCHCALYMAHHHPSEYRWSYPAILFLAVLYIFFYWVWDSSNGQKNAFRHEEKGQLVKRNTWPQVPWQAVTNPRTIETNTGDSIMIDSWFAFVRKPNYVADMFFSMSWGLLTGFKSPFPWFYFVFFMGMIIHRTIRDTARCRRKYGEAWKRYEREVPYIFIPVLHFCYLLVFTNTNSVIPTILGWAYRLFCVTGIEFIYGYIALRVVTIVPATADDLQHAAPAKQYKWNALNASSCGRFSNRHTTREAQSSPQKRARTKVTMGFEQRGRDAPRGLVRIADEGGGGALVIQRICIGDDLNFRNIRSTIPLTSRHGVTLCRQAEPHCSRWRSAFSDLEDADQALLRPIINQGNASSELLDDILRAIHVRKEDSIKRRWRVKINGRHIVIREVLDKLSKCVSKFLTIGDILIQIDPVHAAAPWAVVRLVMQTAVSDFETYGFVLNSVERLVHLISISSIFEYQYLRAEHRGFDYYDNLSQAVMRLYTLILAYLCTVLRYYQLGTATRHLKSMVTSKASMEQRYEPIDSAPVTVDRLAKLADAEKTNTVLQEVNAASRGLQHNSRLAQDIEQFLHELKAPISKVMTDLESINDGLEREMRIKILKAISAIPYPHHHKAARKGRLDGSGLWLFKKTAFQHWQNESTSSVLWLHGITGSGKTKLTSLVVDTLLGDTKVAYFYCMRSPAEPCRGQCDKILASIVRQLASFKPATPILPPALEHYQEAIDGITDFEDHAWSTEECHAVLQTLIPLYPAVAIVIDALDEVQYEERRQLLHVLERLMQVLICPLKIFISSRDDRDIVLQLQNSPNIYIDASDNQEDIDSFMFRWVELQIQSLLPIKVAGDILARLGALPPTLEDSYSEIYRRILESGSHASQLAVFIFTWLLYANRPTPVSVLAVIASTMLRMGGTNENAAQQEELGQTTIGEILDVCENLVVLRDGLLHFAHLSVRDFLESLPGRKANGMAREQGNSSIATACLQYLLFAIERGSKEISLKNGQVSLSDPSFYVVSTETVSIVVQDENGTRLLDALDKREGHPQSVARASRKRRMKENADLTQAQKWANQVAMNLVDEHGPQAMFFAASFWPKYVSGCGRLRSEEPLRSLIRKLLINESDSSTVSLQFEIWNAIKHRIRHYGLFTSETFDPPSPIWTPIWHQWPETAKIIYESNYYDGINDRVVTALDTNDTCAALTPLGFAVSKRHDGAMISTILESYRGTSIAPESGSSSVHLLLIAIENDRSDIVSMLVRNEYGRLLEKVHALRAAAKRGSVSTISALIENHPEILKEGFLSASKIACRHGHLDIVELLLRGTDVESPSDCQELLNSALTNAHGEIAGYLLKRFPPKDFFDAHYLTNALTAAVQDNQRKCVQVLLENGARPDHTALARFIKHGAPEASLGMINAGCNVNGHYFIDRSTPLHLAASSGLGEVMFQLLARGADPALLDRTRRTPLHIAAMFGRKDCTSMLLEHKWIDVVAEDQYDKMALDYAEDRGHNEVATEIRSHMEKLLATLQEEARYRRMVSAVTTRLMH
ncbi:hypothetical protein NLG97_g5047 [Lecanicillium saksenae]|uniref:Uncharacterized protein n=1 Tax=Lecanicillium saksenae TaxID=468837 RepID=A0ACC1QTL7_9HYPO|nr:hypothetical protein NLG97_g5047 [Lecanicillium saksenae]